MNELEKSKTRLGDAHYGHGASARREQSTGIADGGHLIRSPAVAESNGQ